MSGGKYGEFISEFDFYWMTWSYVLAISLSENSLCLRVDAALAKNHPQYSVPLPSEAACWRKAQIHFNNVQALNVTELDLTIEDAGDPAGPHLGELWCIVEEDDHLFLSGEFGSLQIWSDRPRIELDPVVIAGNE